MGVYCVCVYCMSNDVLCTYIICINIISVYYTPCPTHPHNLSFKKGPLLLPTRRQPHTQLPASLASLGCGGFPRDDLPRVSERDVQHIEDESNITQYTFLINGYSSLKKIQSIFFDIFIRSYLFIYPPKKSHIIYDIIPRVT